MNPGLIRGSGSGHGLKRTDERAETGFRIPGGKPGSARLTHQAKVLRRFRRSDGLAQNGGKGMKRDSRNEPEKLASLGRKTRSEIFNSGLDVTGLLPFRP
jgi:hypothetical protein